MDKLIDQYIKELYTLEFISNKMVNDKATCYILNNLIRITKNLATDALLQKEEK